MRSAGSCSKPGPSGVTARGRWRDDGWPEADDARLGEREIDRLGLRVTRAEPRQTPADHVIALDDHDGGARRFPPGRQRERVEHLAERRRAVEAADALEQPGQTGHFRLAFTGTRGVDRRRGAAMARASASATAASRSSARARAC